MVTETLIESSSDSEEQLIDKKEVRRILRRKWDKSLWRILPLPIFSYVTVGTYLWYVNTPDAWQRAAAPMVAILLFQYTAPIVRRTWFAYNRKNLLFTLHAKDNTQTSGMKSREDSK